MPQANFQQTQNQLGCQTPDVIALKIKMMRKNSCNWCFKFLSPVIVAIHEKGEGNLEDSFNFVRIWNWYKIVGNESDKRRN